MKLGLCPKYSRLFFRHGVVLERLRETDPPLPPVHATLMNDAPYILWCNGYDDDDDDRSMDGKQYRGIPKSIEDTGRISGVFRNLKRGARCPVYISGVHFQKCSKFSIFSHYILVQFFTSKGGGEQAQALPKYAPEMDGIQQWTGKITYIQGKKMSEDKTLRDAASLGLSAAASLNKNSRSFCFVAVT